MAKKIAAILFIYIFTVVAWSILGTSMNFRSTHQNEKLKGAVNQLWGTVQEQKAPSVNYQVATEKRVNERKIYTNTGGETRFDITTETKTYYLPLEASTIDTSIRLDYRQKGLLWYSTYHVLFNGQYKVLNRTNEKRDLNFCFSFPSKDSIYDNFHFAVDGVEISDIRMDSGYLTKSITMEPNQAANIDIRYISQGLDEWRYNFGSNVNQVKNFALTMHTDFNDFDFPENSMSPTEKQQLDKGWNLKWQYLNLLSGVRIGLAMPHRLNPGPWVGDVTYSAPISLFLFFFLLFIFTTVKQIKVHPMNYFFIAAAYFSFHLLLAYLVDHLSIHLSFLISSVVSIFLVVSYMRLVVDKRFAFVEIGISQFVYLVLFSYTFFFEGYTGLAITILCVLTLFIVMQFTGRIDWENITRRPGSPQTNPIYKNP